MGSFRTPSSDAAADLAEPDRGLLPDGRRLPSAPSGKALALAGTQVNILPLVLYSKISETGTDLPPHPLLIGQRSARSWWRSAKLMRPQRKS